MRYVVYMSLLSLLVLVPLAYAGSPHMVSCTQSVLGDTLTVEGKEAGLGNETQVHIEVTATAECVNRGGHNPRAANKTSVSAAGDFPVQNGHADFALSVTATFEPSCSPPMSVVFTDVVACDTEHGECCPL